jgi:DNA-binding SARP family transcriptional activator
MTVGQPHDTVVGAKVRVPSVTALVRERLNDRLDRVWRHGLGLVVAPAGSGKTTALAQFAATVDAPVAWYRAEAAEAADPRLLLAYLERALTAALGPLEGGWDSLERAAWALERWPGRRALLVVDDLHVLAASEGERLLGRLVDYAPPALTVLVGSRSMPRLNLSRLRLAGGLLELGADDLRFRSWEVEHLFHDFYREPLPPEDMASLARRTEGWAAGLQLFHLATRGKPAGERRRAVAALASRSKLVRDYLARNVLDELRPELRAFLLDTCVLTRLDGPLCDRLRGRGGSQRLLAELEARQVFTVPLDDEGTYRYHEVLRAHLEADLVDGVGEQEVGARYRRAGALLEQAGALPEALYAYCRAGDAATVARLLGARGGALVDAATWLDTLPPTLAEEDPWLALATARRRLAAGRLRAASAAYQRAELAFAATTAKETCRRERQAATAWLVSAAVPASDWTGLVRAATRRAPLAVRAPAALVPGPQGRLAEGLTALLAGQLGTANQLLATAAEHPEASPALAVGARLAWAAGRLLGGAAPQADEVERIVAQAEALDLPWLARIGGALLSLTGRAERFEEALKVLATCDRDDDAWGGAVISLLVGTALLWRGEAPVELLRSAADRFRQLGAGTLAALAASLAALGMARLGRPGAREYALQAEAAARSAGVRGAQVPALLASAMTGGEHASEHLDLAMALAAECGLDTDRLLRGLPELWPSARGEPAAGSGVAPPPAPAVRCFGGFELRLNGALVALGSLKPRCQALLRLLASNGGRPVHREALIDALWPNADQAAGMRGLQVAVSTLRRFLEPDAGRGEASLLVREGQTYRLALPEPADADVAAFARALAEARAASAAGEARTAERALERALDAYGGDLLPEDGPAEWVVGERERFRAEAAEAAANLAALQLARDAAMSAAATCKRGLAIDHYHDPLWRLLVDAYDHAGEHAAAEKARRGYSAMLAELGLDDLPMAASLR